MLCVKQKSCECQFCSHEFDPTRIQTRVYSFRGGRSTTRPLELCLITFHSFYFMIKFLFYDLNLNFIIQVYLLALHRNDKFYREQNINISFCKNRIKAKFTTPILTKFEKVLHIVKFKEVIAKTLYKKQSMGIINLKHPNLHKYRFVHCQSAQPILP